MEFSLEMGFMEMSDGLMEMVLDVWYGIMEEVMWKGWGWE